MAGDASDDLSGAGEPPAHVSARANAVLIDEKLRTRYRTGATALAVSVITGLFVLLCRLVWALACNLSLVEGPSVALVASLVVAISVLSIALLRFTFAPLIDPEKPVEQDKASDPLPGNVAEALKALGELVSTAMKPFQK